MSQPAPLFVLVHSPLVGPLTWEPVAAELRRRGWDAVVPRLRDTEAPGPPYWPQHVDAVIRALAPIPQQRPLILAGHSGAGMLLPAIRARGGRPVAGYLFVDAGLPADGKSRLDLFGDPTGVTAFREAAVAGWLPTWTEADLAGEIPDPDLRRRFVAELRPLPLAVYEEALPVFAGWPDAPCAYVQFSPIYDAPAAEARRRGWSVRALPGGHFHLLVDPASVAGALIAFAGQTAAPAERDP